MILKTGRHARHSNKANFAEIVELIADTTSRLKFIRHSMNKLHLILLVTGDKSDVSLKCKTGNIVTFRH